MKRSLEERGQIRLIQSDMTTLFSKHTTSVDLLVESDNPVLNTKILSIKETSKDFYLLFC